jgi:hemoglobin
VLAIHSRNGAEDDLGVRFLDCFTRAMDDAGLPEVNEFRAALRNYMEWAVNDVMSYAPLDAFVPGDVSIPRWSWGRTGARALNLAR